MVTAGQGSASPFRSTRSVGGTDLVRARDGSAGVARLGIQALPPELADAFGAKGEKGILVNRVVPGSPAERGGFGWETSWSRSEDPRIRVKEFQRLSPGRRQVPR